MFATIVYSLCGLTSVICAGLLARAFLNSKSRLLLWSALAFAFIAVNNFFVFLDMRVYPQTDFSLYRNIFHLIGVSILLFGLIWESA